MYVKYDKSKKLPVLLHLSCFMSLYRFLTPSINVHFNQSHVDKITTVMQNMITALRQPQAARRLPLAVKPSRCYVHLCPVVLNYKD
jgi:hypothetical protein